jgi:starch-binding outer membrane protein, SusD/RagB family
MKLNKSIIAFFLVTGLLSACKEELQIENPNLPTPESAATENGILALGKGGVYISGFKGLDTKYNDGVPGFFWSGAMGFHSIFGDEVGVEAANWYLNQIGCPDEIAILNFAQTADTIVKNPQNPNTQYGLLRLVNSADQQGANPMFHEWANMYSLNNACNNILSIVENVKFNSGGDTKKKAIQAWAYWWKGFAYSRIGSIYIAGLINSEPNKANNVFVAKEKIIEEANANFDKAGALIKSLPVGGDYDLVMKKLIPEYCQVGLGKIPTPEMWLRNINTLKARNIMANTPVSAMSAAQWGAVLSLTNDGLKSSDNAFTARSDANGDFLNPQTGTVAAKTASVKPGSGTYKLSERLVQDFKDNDKRKENNFLIDKEPWIGNADRGITFNTRYSLIDGGTGLSGVNVLISKEPGETEFYLAGSYEENELMKAEALIYTGKIEDGLGLIDAIRTLQGAGLPAVKGTSLTLDGAKEELRIERRCALAFRGLAFYDARRLGISEKGNSRKNCVIVDGKGVVNTKATIRYNFLDYFDVPANELIYNPAGAGSAPLKNPK